MRKFSQSATLFVCLLLSLWYCKTPNQNQTSSTNPNSTALCGPVTADLNTAPGKDGRLVPLFEGLDVYHYKITTKSRLAQKYFDQGFMLNYGFNHAEAARSFKEAARQDPECAMCYWGLAYVLGPNYNAGMQPEVLIPANEALVKAQMYSAKASPKERALINALSKRYPKALEIDPQPYYEAYADAMREVQKTYPKDVDIAVMTAESLMDLHPWDLYTKAGEPQPWTPEIVNLIEGVLSKDPNHPQAMHLYIHAMEASNVPEKALAAADRLRDRVPGSGHLLHMPSHLYINTGHYHEGSLANERAVKVDSAYVEACHAAGIYPLAYYPHNWHFLAACAALEGRGKRALEASRYMADYTVDQDLMTEPSLATLQHYYSIPWYIMVKFAMWDDILNEPKPKDGLRYPEAIWRYARGMAFANKGEFAKAQAELAIIQAIEKEPGIQEMTVWDINNIVELVSIAKLVLSGEIAVRKEKLEAAIKYFEDAVAIEDQLNYNEPPDWFFSVRHLLGAALLENNQLEEAENVYRIDLKELKNNGWALMGLYQSLQKQGKTKEANTIKMQFKEAWKFADVQLSSSVL